MCGIMAYVGNKQAFPILIDGLKQLEYRGYDSSGVAVMNGSLSLLKTEGKVNDLIRYSKSRKTDGNIGLGHTRWATHGAPTDKNAHPHQSQSGKLTMVHNGIIENYESLKSMLLDCGYTFTSDTDSEVLVQLIEWYIERYEISLETAMSRALQDVEGSFAIVLFDLDNPSKLLVARRQSPLIIGVGNNEFIISSDTMTLADYTDQVIYLEEDVVAILDASGASSFSTLQEQKTYQEIIQIETQSLKLDKGEYDTFMLKEIYEQSKSVERTLSARLNSNNGIVQFSNDITEIIKQTDRIIITACGTSWHSGLVAEYLFEKYARINVEVEYASEFRYKNAILSERDLVIGISQSGETADTIAALEIAKAGGAKTLAVVNGVNSSIARMVDEVLYLNAGPEIGVASTKAFTSQLTAVLLLTVAFSKVSGTVSLSERKAMTSELLKLPSYIEETLHLSKEISGIAYDLMDYTSTLFLGRGMSFPIAIEGALKLKEISYIHAEGYPAGEMKHGPIALVDDLMPVIAIASNDDSLAKLISNVQEVKARKAKVLIVKNKSTVIPNDLAEYIIDIPDCPSYLNPILQSIPLQLLSYYIASLKGCNVDQPRNLAKSVTVE